MGTLMAQYFGPVPVNPGQGFSRGRPRAFWQRGGNTRPFFSSRGPPGGARGASVLVGQPPVFAPPAPQWALVQPAAVLTQPAPQAPWPPPAQVPPPPPWPPGAFGAPKKPKPLAQPSRGQIGYGTDNVPKPTDNTSGLGSTSKK